MVDQADFLVEIGCEELPPKALLSLAKSFSEQILKGLKASDLNPGDVTIYAAPRRLAVHIAAVKSAQKDQKIEKQGPLISAPDQAKEGFARSCGVTLDELETIQTDKGEKLSYKVSKKGLPAFELVPDIIDKALKALPIPRRMRWGSGDFEFVRPVKWVVMMHGEQVIDAIIMGVKTSDQTLGHRFHHPGAIQVTPSTYSGLLEQPGKVLASFDSRRDRIQQQVTEVAKQLGGVAVIEAGLLDEVTALVEWPVALAGNFDAEFLDVPHEALIYTMQDNQKYFPVTDKQGKLLPHFITVSNIESNNPSAVIEGNERVIRPRLADADFFWQQDKKKKLIDHAQSLEKIIFQKQLGTLADKTKRVMALSGYIAEKIGANVSDAQRAAELSKCDLMTDMVGEFPAMQGIAGRYYATNDGESEAVAQALEQQYWPKQAGDRLPEHPVSQCLALADRIDTMVGMFGIGQPPTGSKDPFALRRSSLAILRILIEGQLDLDLVDLFQKSQNQYDAKLTENNINHKTFTYCTDRLYAYYKDRGVNTAFVDAVAGADVRKPLDFDQRVRGVSALYQLPESNDFSVAIKRTTNILDKSTDKFVEQVNESLLHDDSEKSLYAAIEKQKAIVEPLFMKKEYEQGLVALASLKKPLDTFFDSVMVNDEDEKLRQNRLALLNSLRALFIDIADLSQLQAA